MTDRLKSHFKNPWAWMICLLVIGVGLSIGSTSRGTTTIRIPTDEALTSRPDCIPVLEKTKEGSFTGRITCASERLAREICDPAKYPPQGKDRQQ